MTSSHRLKYSDYMPLNEEIEQRIQQIADTLKKPGIPDLERQLLNEDRRDLRELLTRRKLEQLERERRAASDRPS